VGLRVGKLLGGSSWRVILAGQSPENSVALVEREKPDVVVIVDAAEMGLAPGEFRQLQLSQTARMIGSTHALPLGVLVQLLRPRAKRVVLIGVQTGDRSLGEGLTPAVEQGAVRLAAILREGRWEEVEDYTG